jgi:Ca-activated chloride channel family protein
VRSICALGCALAFSALAGHAQGVTPTISVNVRLVNVFVNVTDDKGAPVPGLTRDEFLLTEDDHPQKIAVFERQSELPLEIVLAIDTSGSVHKDLPLEQDAARHFVRSLLRPVDHLDLMEFSDNVREVVFFTNNLGRIDRGLNDMGRGAATALYSGVYLASQSLAPRSGRKVLVIISDGGNTVKGTTYDQALEQALRGEVMVYPIIDVPIYASAGRDLAGEHALITLTRPLPRSQKTCGRNTCWATIHRTGREAPFAPSPLSCVAPPPVRATTSAIARVTIPRPRLSARKPAPM